MPEMTAVAPLIGGGGLADIGIRSNNGGAVAAFVLRTMCPIYVGTLDANLVALDASGVTRSAHWCRGY